METITPRPISTPSPADRVLQYVQEGTKGDARIRQSPAEALVSRDTIRAIPGSKYLKVEGDEAILGRISDTGEFVPDTPRRVYDRRYLISNPYPYLPGTIKKGDPYIYTNNKGQRVEESIDPVTHEIHERVLRAQE